MVKCNVCKASGRRVEKCLTCKSSFHLVCLTKKKSGQSCCLSSVYSKIRNTCHRCQSNLTDKKIECSNTECNEVFCTKCIKYRYKYDLSGISDYWECFVCLKTCSCKSCRKKAAEKSKKITEFVSNEVHVCHYCQKKMSVSRLSYCDDCKNSICSGCSEQVFGKLDNCPVCLDICTCTKCGDLRFNKDFPEFYKGVDLRKLYPYDQKNIFYINGFWVRSINL